MRGMRQVTGFTAPAIALVLAVALLAGAAPAQARTGRGSPARTAASLVAAVRRARTPRGRQRALLGLMRALHIAVYTPADKPLVGTATAPRHAFLYDFELLGLGDALARGDRLPVSELAERLNAAGLHRPGKTLSAAALASALSAAVREGAKRPHSHGSLPALVLRALGLTDHPRLDFSKLKPTDQVDPVQAVLVTMAFAQLAYDSPSGGGPRRASRPLLAVSSSAADYCGTANDVKETALGLGMDGLGGTLMKKVVKKLLKERYLSKAQQAVLKKAGAILDAVHGAALAFSVAVHGEPESAGPVHYNHLTSEHNVLEMHVKVEMLDKYGDFVVKCGPLLGLKFPKKGGIPDIGIRWQRPKLEEHGTVVCEVKGCGHTGPDGVATLKLLLKSEQIPGYGLEREDTAVADALAEYQSAFGASLTGGSRWAQYLTPKIGGVRWHVTYHQEPNLTLRLTAQHSETFTNQTESCWAPEKCSTTGSGSGNFAISAEAPLSPVTASDGASFWTGDAPINWDTFSFHDDGANTGCQDGNVAILDLDGSAPSPGELIVDSVQQDQGAPPPGIAVVLHAAPEPGYTYTQTIHPGSSGCAEYSNSLQTDWWAGPSYAFLAPNVAETSFENGPHASPTYRITGWQPGPASHGGEGVYAYRDFSYSRTDAWGEPIGGTLRLEVIASPAP